MTTTTTTTCRLLVTTNASHMDVTIIICIIIICIIISQIGIKVMNGTLYHSPHPIIGTVLLHTVVIAIAVVAIVVVIDMLVMIVMLWWLMLQVLVEHSPHGMLHLIQVTLAQQQQLLFVVVVVVVSTTTATGHVLLYPLDQQVPCHRFHLLLQTSALSPVDHSGHIHDDLPGR